MNRLLLSFLALVGLVGCEKEGVFHQSTTTVSNKPHNCTSSTCGLDRIYMRDGEKYLWSGSDSSAHFVITDWLLEDARLRDHGMDREAFPALIDPLYSAITDPAHQVYEDEERVVVVKGNEEIHAYPFSLMTYHEVVNGEIDGEGYMVCYCVLADFSGVYYSKTCGVELTYGVSGYTYVNSTLGENEGVEAFILWDRETESLWNPLDGLGVSHTLMGVPMPKYPVRKWEVITWKELSQTYPNARVLKTNQDMNSPESWPSVACEEFGCCKDL